VIGGENPGARAAHRGWYRELFQPCVAAGLMKAGALAGYRTGLSANVTLCAAAGFGLFFEKIEERRHGIEHRVPPVVLPMRTSLFRAGYVWRGDRETFGRRVADGAKNATARLSFTLDTHELVVERRLNDLTLVQFSTRA